MSTVQSAGFGLAMPLFTVLLVGCADDPRPARRATAIDVAGDWVEVRDAGAGASLKLANEDGIVDVVAEVQGRVVGDAEAAVIARVPAERRSALVERLVLGSGRDAVLEETDGGENVSFDGGITTTVQVRGPAVTATPSAPTARDATIIWALRLDGDASALAGSLLVLVSESVPEVGDVDGFARETSRIEVPMRFVRAEGG